MKVIDTHTHIGTQGKFDLSSERLLSEMDKNGISLSIVSAIECCEYQAERPILMEDQIPQVEANEKLLGTVNANRGKLRMSFFCKPATEANHDEVYSFIKKNRELVVGMKWHPFYSRLPLESKKYEGYIDIARQLDLPISVHTAADDLSSPIQLLALAKKWRDVSFIMVHMGLCSDNSEAIFALGEADNLYGDTTWVPYEKTVEAIEKHGSGRMLFGSDAPIDGERSYDYYKRYLTEKTDFRDALVYGNASELFGIKL